MKNIFKKEKNIDRIAYAAVLFFILVFVWLSFGRHDALKSYLNDISAIDQSVWNTLKGRVMTLSSSLLDDPQFFAARFSPILFFFVPLYAFFASPKWLLLFQAISVGLGAIPVYLIAKEKLKSFLLAFVFLASYLLYPILHNALLYDFHEVVLAVGFAAWAFYFLEKKNDKLFLLFAALLVLSQEYLALLVFAMGFVIIFIKKRRTFGAMVSLAALAYYIVIVAVVMPHLAITGKAPYLANNMVFASRYSWLGSSFFEIAKNILAHPLSVMKVIFSFIRLKYLFFLVAPVFSLPLLSWPFLIILPVVFVYLLSSNSITYDVYYYHSAVFAPFIFFAAIYTFKKWFLDSQFLRITFAVFILTFSLGTSVLYGVSPISLNYKLSDYAPSAHARKIGELKKMIPSDASLCVQHNLGPHFSDRQYIYRFPVKSDEAQYILLDDTDPYRDNPKQIFLFPNALQMEIPEWKDSMEKLKNSSDFELVYDNDGYLLFRRK